MNYPGFFIQCESETIRPSSIYCIGRNYAEHAKELNNPVPSQPLVFLKSISSLRGLKPSPMAFSQDVYHHEVELVLLVGEHLAMGSSARNSSIAGFGLGLDLTRREAQSLAKKDGHPWTLAKSFKGSAVLAPLFKLNGRNLDALVFGLRVNGEQRQYGKTSDMLVKPSKILDYLLTFNDLFPGDLIYTGTPSGVGPIKQHDRFELFIEGTDYEHGGII